MFRPAPTDEDRAIALARAIVMWHGFDANERAMVRFGMFPAEKMGAAEADGIDGRTLAVALMDCAKADGGMRA
jgi:hypothetical protein